MADDVDWQVVTFAGNRRRRHEEFRALPLREKLKVIEQLSEVAEYFRTRRRGARPIPGAQASGPCRGLT